MSLVQYDNSKPKSKEAKTALTITVNVKNKPIVQYMDKSELKTRELKYLSLVGYDDRNEPRTKRFPNCEHDIIKNKNGNFVGNVGNYTIEIPNTDPVIDVKMVNFPNCTNCNTDHAVIIIEKII